MGFVEVQPKSDFWNPQTEGESIQGVYVDCKEDKYGKSFVIETSPGVRVTTRAHASLISRMEFVKIGSKVRIEYRGVLDTKRGEMKLYKVFLWQGDPYMPDIETNFI